MTVRARRCMAQRIQLLAAEAAELELEIAKLRDRIQAVVLAYDTGTVRPGGT